MLKKELTPWRRVQRCYLPVPPEADEAVLDLYSRPYDAHYPAIRLDEQPKSLRADKRPPPPARPGHLAAYAYAYARRGPCTLWMFVEPLGQWRTANAAARRTGVDWAHQAQALADPPRDRQAERLIRVCDPLNTHTYASFYRAFPPAERAAWPVQLAFPPRHGRWLHRAKPELSVLTRQALSPRRPTQDAVPAQVPAWAEARNAAPKGIHWPFRTADARVRLKRLYPTIET